MPGPALALASSLAPGLVDGIEFAGLSTMRERIDRLE
jgi:hypothetical protein